MNVGFRVDAGVQIGTGHVMRCLTLADALSAGGASCTFYCRGHEGNLADVIRRRGHSVVLFPVLPGTGEYSSGATLAHAAWLGAAVQVDATQVAEAVGAGGADWLVVDHYGVDAAWERALRRVCQRMLVIDDLADREHDCDLLIDQNIARVPDDYLHLLPPSCKILLGPQYALLRPGFAERRPGSLRRRQSGELRRWLITLGGVDKNNHTSAVLRALARAPLAAGTSVTVVLGDWAPWIDDVRKTALEMPWPTNVLVSADNMPSLMADADVAIGAAGSTSWERCALGLPTLMLIVAENQVRVGSELFRAGAALLLDAGNLHSTLTECVHKLRDAAALRHMSARAAAICAGCGTPSVIEAMRELT